MRPQVRLVVAGVGVLLGAWLMLGVPQKSHPTILAQTPALEPLSEPPEGQTFIGAKQCSSCHFEQFLKWKKTKHAKGFEILPAKYKKDVGCLKCHSTGFGEETGYKDAKTPELAGTTCEACHGPGSKHGEIAKGFGNKKLTKEEEVYVRSTTHKLLPGNACIQCHLPQSHKEHPPYDKK